MTRQYKMLLPMGGLYAVSFYDGTRVPTKDGYRQEPLNGYALPWKWFVSPTSNSCVRAFLLKEPIRILAASVGDGDQAYDIPASLVLVHGLHRIWAMTPESFESEYYPVASLIEKIPKKSNV